MPLLIAGGLALIALLVGLLASMVFTGPSGWNVVIKSILSQIPVAGSWIDKLIGSVFGSAASSILGWVDSQLPPLAEFFWGHAVGIWGALHAAATFAGQVPAALARQHNFTAQWAASLITYANTGVTQAEIYSTGLYDDAIAFANQWGVSLTKYADTGIAQAEAAAQALHADAIAFTNQWAVSLTKYADTGVAQVENDLSNLRSSLGSVITGDVASLTTKLDGLVSTVETDAAKAAAAIAAATSAATQAGAAAAGVAINAGAADVFNPAWTAILGALQPIVRAIPTTAAEALGLPATLEGTSAATIPAILALTIPALGAVATEVAECVVPTCEALGPLANILGNLESDLFLAALLALLAEVAHNPKAAVDDITSTIGGAVNDASSAFRSLVGV